VLLLLVVRTFRRQSAVSEQLDALERSLSKPRGKGKRENAS
jgi:hypothetical protein